MPPENDTQFPASSPVIASRDGSLRATAVVLGSTLLPVESSDTMEVLSPWDESDMNVGNSQDLAHTADRNRNGYDPATPLRPSTVVEGSCEAFSLGRNESSFTDLRLASLEPSFRIQTPSIPARNSGYQREESAEEVLQASLNFDRSSPPSRVPLGFTQSGTSLYPSLEGLDQDLFNEEGKEEIPDLASVPMYATASIQESTEEATILAITQDEELLAMKMAAYAGNISSTQAPSQDQEATVVAIADNDVHPSDISHGAVQAEFIGHNNALFDHSSSEPLSFDPDSSYTAVEAESADDTTTEATVIDSAPISLEGDLPLWKVTEEARVLLDADATTPPMDRKPAAVESTDEEEAEEFAVADQEAEIVEIQEEVHPFELAGATAEAELIGTDDSFNVAVLSPQRHAVAEAFIEEDGASTYQEDEFIEEAAVMGESVPPGQDSEVREARATPVEADYSTSPSLPTKPVHPLASESENVPMPRDGIATPVDTYDDSWIHTPTFGSQDSSFPAAIPPPEEMNYEDMPPGWLQEDSVPSPRAFGSAGRDVSNSSGAASESSNPSQRMLSGIGNVMEALFGDTKLPVGRRRITTDDAKGSILPRSLLPWTVMQSPSTSMWIVTLQTNQKALDSNKVQEASKSLRAFSLPTEKQAVGLAQAWAPPRMYRFTDSPICHICESKFAIFRRACHCRNCGVCVCKDCVTQWPAKMVPDTYNKKKGLNVNVCKTCDWLCTAFRLALLEGDADKAVALSATGNVNLHSPFGNVKGELFYPVHCAVLGKNLSLLEWLVDENCCPIKSVRVSGLSKDSYGKYTAIVTSKNRSLLGIAMENESVDIVRYLVVDKGIALAGEKDVTADMLMRNLDLVLRLLPRNTPCATSDYGEYDDTIILSEPPTAPVADFSDVEPIYPVGFNEWEGSRTLSEEARDFGAVYQHGPSRFEGQVGSDNDDECIICFDSRIDCVATPCGHQICCLKCSEHISRCPVCAADCSFMRVFKP